MFAIRNALKNIYRYRNKYILFGLVYLIIVLSASICVTIFVYIGGVTDNILTEYASVSVLERGIAMSNAFGSFELPNRLSREQYLGLKDVIEHVGEIRFLQYNFATDFLKENVSKLEVTVNIDGDVTLINTTPMQPVFVLGYNISLLHLISEEFNLERGRIFERDGEVVISKNSRFVPTKNRIWDEISASWISLDLMNEYEQWNYLDIGDRIVIQNDDGFFKEFTVVGIKQESYGDSVNTNRRMIHTTLESAEYFETIAKIKEAGIRAYPITVYPFQGGRMNSSEEFIRMGYDVLVYLDSPEIFLDLQRQMWNKEIYGFLFHLRPLFPNFRPLINLTRTTWENVVLFTILIAFILIAVTIIATLILLSSRKYEIAVLRSTGTKKSRIIVSYLIENLAFVWSIALVSLVAAQFIAPLLTRRTFESMRELMSPESFENIVSGGGIGLILQNAGLVFGGATVVVALSLVIACINIVRFEPLKIFNNQH